MTAVADSENPFEICCDFVFKLLCSYKYLLDVHILKKAVSVLSVIVSLFFLLPCYFYLSFQESYLFWALTKTLLKTFMFACFPCFTSDVDKSVEVPIKENEVI